MTAPEPYELRCWIDADDAFRLECARQCYRYHNGLRRMPSNTELISALLHVMDWEAQWRQIRDGAPLISEQCTTLLEQATGLTASEHPALPPVGVDMLPNPTGETRTAYYGRDSTGSDDERPARTDEPE